jgi:uncharacterized protein YunC (DUF1805 family)
LQTREIDVDDKKAAGFHIDLNGVPLLVARGSKGFVMCGYLNISAADKFGQAAAVVKGVRTLDELLEKEVSEVSAAAAKLGVMPGMTGRQALSRLA